MSRIAATFGALRKQGRRALIPFITAGDPDPALAVPLMHALVEGGADIIELGVPFSDPMADGPTIQRSSERALKHGVRLRDVVGYVREFRRENHATPVVLFGYANPIEALGTERFADAVQSAGVDGVLVVDYPPEEASELVRLLNAREVDTVFLLSPTTGDARLRQAAALGRGYLYYVSLKGVTGASHIDYADVAAHTAHIRSFTKLPVGVGFGIRDAEMARNIARVADGVVIGSRLVEEIERSPRDRALGNVTGFLKEIRSAMDSALPESVA